MSEIIEQHNPVVTWDMKQWYALYGFFYCYGYSSDWLVGGGVGGWGWGGGGGVGVGVGWGLAIGLSIVDM